MSSNHGSSWGGDAKLNVSEFVSSNDSRDISARVYVGNLASSVDRDLLYKIFYVYGHILAIQIIKQYGFVQYYNYDDAMDAITHENGRMVEGKKLVCNLARRKDSRPEKDPSIPVEPLMSKQLDGIKQRNPTGQGGSKYHLLSHAPTTFSHDAREQPVWTQGSHDGGTMPPSTYPTDVPYPQWGEPELTQQPPSLLDTPQLMHPNTRQDVVTAVSNPQQRDRSNRERSQLRNPRDRSPRRHRRTHSRSPLWTDTPFQTPPKGGSKDSEQKKPSDIDRRGGQGHSVPLPVNRPAQTQHRPSVKPVSGGLEEGPVSGVLDTLWSEGILKAIDVNNVFARLADCTIISQSIEQKEYCVNIVDLLNTVGLKTDIHYLDTTTNMAMAIDTLARKGTIYAIVVTPDNFRCKSCTLHILQAIPPGQVQTSVWDIPHWIKMHEEYNKVLLQVTKQNESLRSLIVRMTAKLDPATQTPPVGNQSSTSHPTPVTTAPSRGNKTPSNWSQDVTKPDSVPHSSASSNNVPRLDKIPSTSVSSGGRVIHSKQTMNMTIKSVGSGSHSLTSPVASQAATVLGNLANSGNPLAQLIVEQILELSKIKK